MPSNERDEDEEEEDWCMIDMTPEIIDNNHLRD